MTPTGRTLRLGLVGAGISRSLAPAFHRRAGQLTDIAITYDLLEHPPEARDRLPDLIDRYRGEGYDGLNVTYPFKEVALHAVSVGGPTVEAVGAVNTVVFAPPGSAASGWDGRPVGYNTDHSGLRRRWRHRFGARRPGRVALLGAGGVGRAAAFALGDLGAVELRVFDLDPTRCRRLAADVSGRFPAVASTTATSAEEAVTGADGIVNGTPIGMHFAPGAPVDLAAVGAQTWVFDAVYAPLETPLMARAREEGLAVLEGFELFLGQGHDAFEAFTGSTLAPDLAARLEHEMWQLVRSRS
jgi:shikimate dehydrogenase